MCTAVQRLSAAQLILHKPLSLSPCRRWRVPAAAACPRATRPGKRPHAQPCGLRWQPQMMRPAVTGGRGRMPAGAAAKRTVL